MPGVGYPNPNRSHFESMAIWHTARFDPEERKGYGWLGRALDPAGGDSFAVGGDVPRALRGRRSAAVALTRLEDLLLADAGAGEGAAGPDVAATTCSRSSAGRRSTRTPPPTSWPPWPTASDGGRLPGHRPRPSG